MYRMAVMSFLAPKELDRNKCIQMSLIHDLAECIVGDLAPADKVSKEDKRNRERAAMLSLSSMLDDSNGKYLLSIYSEYEAHETGEANFVKSLDLFDMYLQAYEYEQLNENLDLSEFFSKIPAHLQVDEGDEKPDANIKNA